MIRKETPMRPWLRKILVRVVAFGMRRSGWSAAGALQRLGEAYPHRDVFWRIAILEDAQDRNQRRVTRRQLGGGLP